MIICIVEDEPVIANRIERFTCELIDAKPLIIKKFTTLEAAHSYIITSPIHLLFLDLNLKNKDGYDLLRTLESKTFYTIIISAYQEKAIESFQFSIVDFIEKPFDKERLKTALEKIKLLEEKNHFSKNFLSVKRNSEIKLIDIKEIKFIKGANVYSEIYLKNEDVELHHLNLEKIDNLLPEYFLRVHKSYILNIYFVDKFTSHGGSKYSVTLKTGENLPVSRAKYKEIKEMLSIT